MANISTTRPAIYSKISGFNDTHITHIHSNFGNQRTNIVEDMDTTTAADLSKKTKTDLIALLEEQRLRLEEIVLTSQAKEARLEKERQQLAEENIKITERLESQRPVVEQEEMEMKAAAYLNPVTKTKAAKDIKKLPLLDSLSLFALERYLVHVVAVKDIEQLDMTSRIEHGVLRQLGSILGKGLHDNRVLLKYLKELAAKKAAIASFEVEERLDTILAWPTAEEYESGKDVIERFFANIRVIINEREFDDFRTETSRLVAVVISKIPDRLLVPGG